MNKKYVKLGVLILSTLLVVSCNSNSTLPNFSEEEQLNSFGSVSALSTQLSNQVESEEQEILIDQDYYKSFPDKVLATDVLDQIQSGVVPDLTSYKPQVNEVQAQSFFSIFNKKAIIDIYDSYGTPNELIITGRVYKKKSISEPQTGDGKLSNIIRTIKTFTPDGISNLDVAVNVNGTNQTGKTDNKGFFKVTFSSANVKNGVNTVLAKLNSNKYQFDIKQEEVVIDSKDSNKVGVISDFDDTVKYTGVHQKIKMVKDILLGNYKTDKPYLGTNTLYKGILNGPKGTGFECMHFVTGSPAMLYDRIQSFLKLNKFPQSSVALKKPGSKIDPNPSETYEYKVSKIRPMMKMYPNKKFVLFGDTTQKDTEVYSTIKKEFPDNVLAIYINNVTKQDQSNPRFKDVLLTNSAIDAAQDLLQKGIITQETLNQVIQDVKG